MADKIDIAQITKEIVVASIDKGYPRIMPGSDFAGQNKLFIENVQTLIKEVHSTISSLVDESK